MHTHCGAAAVSMLSSALALQCACASSVDLNPVSCVAPLLLTRYELAAGPCCLLVVLCCWVARRACWQDLTRPVEDQVRCKVICRRNCNARQLAMWAEEAASALCDRGSISERRLFKT